MKASIDLGLAVSGLHARKGVPMTTREIAAFCGCSKQRITQIEERALRKLRNRLMFVKDPELRELVESLMR
jgi:DNA-directed RNA polymerase sigma subunit (sigma70/sigma32)